MHYWYGCIDTPQNDYGKEVTKFRIITDNLKIVRDKGNRIPDKSWMLYLLEIFNIQRFAVELNLICQFDNQDYFEAIFKGHNQYRFTKVLPQIGHSFHRQIKFLENESILEYYLKDLNSNEDEKFSLKVSREQFAFQFHQSFTGVEWWNRISYSTYPVRYEIEVSNLMYGFNDNLYDPNSLLFFPIGSIYENKDGTTHSYPIKFYDLTRRNGCVCYLVK
jgi:hypothetical protein